MSVNIVFFRCPLETSEESEKPTEVSRRLFAYFLVGEKVGPWREREISIPFTPQSAIAASIRFAVPYIFIGIYTNTG